MTYCTCLKDSKGCYICKPNDFILYMGCWYRKDESMPKDCGCGERKMSSPVSSPPAVKEREYQIDEQLERLERNANQLTESIELLYNKLSRIMKSEPIADTKNEARLTPTTPLASELYDYNTTIERGIYNINEIYHRIEMECK